jgi:hypothetical protein
MFCGQDGVVGLDICTDCGEALPHEEGSAQERAHAVAWGYYANPTADEWRRWNDWERREWNASWSDAPLFTQDEVDVLAAGGLRPLRERPEPFDFECPICERGLDFEGAADSGHGLMTSLTISESGALVGWNSRTVCNQPKCMETTRERNQKAIEEATE